MGCCLSLEYYQSLFCSSDDSLYEEQSAYFSKISRMKKNTPGDPSSRHIENDLIAMAIISKYEPNIENVPGFYSMGDV